MCRATGKRSFEVCTFLASEHSFEELDAFLRGPRNALGPAALTLVAGLCLSGLNTLGTLLTRLATLSPLRVGLVFVLLRLELLLEQGVDGVKGLWGDGLARHDNCRR